MNRATEYMVEILRRSGPGAMSIPRLRAELRRRRPPIVLSAEGIREVVVESEGRLVQLQLGMNDVSETDLDGWILLMRREDAPARGRLAALLWQSLAALAEDIEVDSHVEVARWILHAERASRVCMSSEAIRYRGSP